MDKIKSRILSAEVMELHNKKNGEVNYMTKIEYQYRLKPDDDIRIGPNILVCYRPGNCLSKLKRFISTCEEVDIEISERVQDNSIKKTISKVSGLEL